MGRVLKAAVLLLGLIAFGFGSWIVGTACLLYLLLSLRSVKSETSASVATIRMSVSKRTAVSMFLAILGLVAFASGGTYSPVVFVALAILVYLWPFLSAGLRLSGVIPVDESILLRSRFLPFIWHAVAEVKPGSGDIPRALSSFDGTLVVAKEGRVFTYATALAFDFRSAQMAVDAILKEAASSISEKGAYLLPIDSKAACELLSWKLVPLKSNSAAFPGPGADVVALESRGSYVKRACAFKAASSPRATPNLPSPRRPLERDVLLWDVLQSIGKVHPWQEPDSYSSLLESIHATESEPIGQRLNAIDSSAEAVTVQTHGGDHVSLSRAQLRAIVALYS